MDRSFAHLLDRLHADAAQAGLEYERLRGGLVRFFRWRCAPSPDECADETLDRLARRLAGGAPVPDIGRYAHGIAKHVLLERRRLPVPVSLENAPEPATPWPSTDVDDENPLRRCFDRCLMTMSDDARSLVLEYYVGERHVKIANRRRLASARGLSENALRSRVQRLRDGLQSCVYACTGAGGAS